MTHLVDGRRSYTLGEKHTTLVRNLLSRLKTEPCRNVKQARGDTPTAEVLVRNALVKSLHMPRLPLVAWRRRECGRPHDQPGRTLCVGHSYASPVLVALQRTTRSPDLRIGGRRGRPGRQCRARRKRQAGGIPGQGDAAREAVRSPDQRGARAPSLLRFARKCLTRAFTRYACMPLLPSAVMSSVTSSSQAAFVGESV